MMYTHVVFDDLREFSPARDGVVYLRNVTQAQEFFEQLDLEIDTLWLDFDLGLDANDRPMVTEPVMDEIAHRMVLAPSSGPPRINHIYIVTANVVGRSRLMWSCAVIAPHVKVVNPIDYCLVNLQRW